MKRKIAGKLNIIRGGIQYLTGKKTSNRKTQIKGISRIIQGKVQSR